MTENCVCLNKDHLTGDKRCVWLVAANEQAELILNNVQTGR